MRDILMKNRKWLIVLAALFAVSLVIIVVRAAEPEPRTVAEPPGESEVTFDLDSNKVYSAEDGVIVIPASAVPAADSAHGVAPVSTVISDAADAVWQPDEIAQSRSYTLPEQTKLADGSIGQLSIPKLGLAVEQG